MTKEDEFHALANAPMSVPDRLKGLMDAATKHQEFADFRRSLTEQLETTNIESPVGVFITGQIDCTVEAECLAQEELAAWASALLTDGTLGDCQSFLINRDQFQQHVERIKSEQAQPKDLPDPTTLWARIFGSRKAAQAPSPTL